MEGGILRPINLPTPHPPVLASVSLKTTSRCPLGTVFSSPDSDTYPLTPTLTSGPPILTEQTLTRPVQSLRSVRTSAGPHCDSPPLPHCLRHLSSLRSTLLTGILTRVVVEGRTYLPYRGCKVFLKRLNPTRIPLEFRVTPEVQTVKGPRT